MQVIFDFNSNSPRYTSVLSAFKKTVGQIGEIHDFGMGVHGVDPTYVIKGDRDAMVTALVAEGYTVGFAGSDASVSITPPYTMWLSK